MVVKNDAKRRLVLLIWLLAGCSSGAPVAFSRLDSMPTEEARREFTKLLPAEQVAIVSWELQTRRPASSKFDYLLPLAGSEVVPFLLSEASETKNFNVNITMLLVLQRMDSKDSVNRLQLHNAIAKCYELGGKKNMECLEVERKLAK